LLNGRNYLLYRRRRFISRTFQTFGVPATPLMDLPICSMEDDICSTELDVLFAVFRHLLD